MNPYWFFFSYARLDRDPYLKKFYNELVDSVRVNAGGNRGEIGFFDTEDIEPGQEWPAALAAALQTARVFVPVYTPSYFISEFCGREWRVIEERRRAAGERPPVILPVLWVPQDKLPSNLPEAVLDLQYSHEQFGEVYVKEGLRQLMRQSRYLDARRQIIDGLAERIIEIAREHPLPPLPAPPSIKQVPSAFQPPPGAPAPPAPSGPGNVGPRYVQFIFVAGRRNEFELQKLRKKLEYYGGEGGPDWQPYLPDLAEEIAILAMGVATSEKLRYEAVPLDESLIRRLDEAERDNKVVAIIADIWTLRLEQYHRFMREYDRRSYQNCVVLIPWNYDEETKLTEETLKQAVELTFVNRYLSRDPNTFIDTIRSPEELRTNLSRALNAARMRIFTVAEVKKKAESGNVIAKSVLQN
ncbi:MAG TPA: TIR-like protein FxsC [Thermoanaerobaculia bacterium]|nr:TIR-like protein FxsC [Thermoanaerobaculia bacterium]